MTYTKIVRGTNNGHLPAPADFRVTHDTKDGILDVHVARLTAMLLK